ncbi:MAG: hypothetical protein JNG83_04670 [Opitutaceae bacterium]|nr:hypothetical protein [Opitutaceae bacterium]
MQTKIPAELKAAVPSTQWGKVLSATPVVMTVIATLLAGLANSEMTKAQYLRALAAQQQSKAGDQWGFFQAKRLRGAIQLGTLDGIQAAGERRAVDAAGLRAFAAALPDPEPVQAALGHLLSGRLPEAAPAPAPDARVQAALDGVEQGLPDAEVAARLHATPADAIADALRAAQDRVRAFDARLRPIVAHGDRLGDALEAADGARRALDRDFTVLRLRFASQRYDAEARLNQAVAVLHELQVRQSNLAAERHHRRSQRFFYGMLGAQAAVIIATFALAAHRRNFLWSLAAAAGLGALAFAVYVFVYL